MPLQQRRQQVRDERLRQHVAQRHLRQQRNQPRDELRVLRGFDDQGQLHRRRGHLHRRLRALIQRAVHDVGPVNQLGNRLRIEPELRRPDMRQKAGAGCVVGIEKFPRCRTPGPSGSLRKCSWSCGVRNAREMMVEPPGDLRRGRILEVDNRVLVAGKLALIKQRASPMHQPVIIVGGVLRDALAMEPRKQRCGTGPVETLVVVEHFDPQPHQLLSVHSGKAGRVRIIRAAHCVKERRAEIGRTDKPDAFLGCTVDPAVE